MSAIYTDNIKEKVIEYGHSLLISSGKATVVPKDMVVPNEREDKNLLKFLSFGICPVLSAP